MAVPKVLQTYKNIQRLRDIANVFIKHGFGHFVEQLNLQQFISVGKRILTFKSAPAEHEPEPATIPARMRSALEELGPTFVKFGQLLSSRQDLLPQSYIVEFKKLLDEVPPVPFESVRQVVESEFRAPLETIFDEFDKSPCAAASIAQVHFARLPASAGDGAGTDVAVKVQRPGIRETVESDITIMLYLAHLAESYIEDASFLNPVELIEEFSRSIHRELNFDLEASNAGRFKKNFDGADYVKIPEVYWEYTTPRVMTLERIYGIPFDRIGKVVDDLASAGKPVTFDRKGVAENGAKIYLKMILEDGFFHADPHPGNLVVMEGNVIGLIDFGRTGRLAEELREHVANIFLAIMTQDYDKLVAEYAAVGIIRGEVDIDRFTSDLRDLFEPYYGSTVGKLNASKMLQQSFQLAYCHKLTVPAELALLVMTLVTIEGNASALDPEINFIELARPSAMKLLMKQYDPVYRMKKAYKLADELAGAGKEIPFQVAKILQKAVDDRLRIDFNHRGLDPFIRDMDKSSNRISFALVIASLIVGSSLLIQSSAGPALGGYSMLGLFGFGIAAFAGLWLIISIFRSGRL